MIINTYGNAVNDCKYILEALYMIVITLRSGVNDCKYIWERSE